MGEEAFGVAVKKVLRRLEECQIINERLQDTEKPGKQNYILRISPENNALLPACIHFSVCGGGREWGVRAGWYK